MEINMNDLEKRKALEQIWNDWDGNINSEDDIMELEADMHRVLKPNRRELNKLAHDIFISKFINEKIQELNESHERFVSPNTYYGVPR